MSTSSVQTAPAVAIIPRPVQISLDKGQFNLDKSTRIFVGAGCEDVANRLRGYLCPGTGFPLTDSKSAKTDIIELQINPSLTTGSEGYQMTVTPQNVVIIGGSAAGVFYGLQSLRQLLPASTFLYHSVDALDRYQIPCLSITDYPRFGWRGAHLDVGRHFMPKEFILKFLDLMALHKLNSFHWHLTEDQGWRLQIPQYPKLTEIGAWRDKSMLTYDPPTYDNRRHGGFYTIEDVKEVVAFAKARFINVVPEIEMPGHAEAAVASYPELGNTEKQVQVRDEWGVSENTMNMNDSTVSFCKNVLTEVLKLFPSKFIHLGGDEAPTTQWASSPDAQARMKQLGITNPRGLQSWFTHQMDQFLTEHHRRLIGWDEILEGGDLAPGATVMSWRGEAGGIAAAKAGHDVVMAPSQYTYLDHYQSRDRDLEPHAIGGLLTLHQIYDYEPIPRQMSAEDAKHVLGAQAQIWTEYIPDSEHVEYMAYPRLCAFSEVVWSPKEGKDYRDFLSRLTAHLPRLDALGVNYRVPEPQKLILGGWSTLDDTNTSKSLKIGIGDFVRPGQLLRIGCWNDGASPLKASDVALNIQGQLIRMVPSPTNPDVYEAQVPAQAQMDGATVTCTITRTAKKQGQLVIELLPDPKTYHPYREGSE